MKSMTGLAVALLASGTLGIAIEQSGGDQPQIYVNVEVITAGDAAVGGTEASGGEAATTEDDVIPKGDGNDAGTGEEETGPAPTCP